VQLNHLISDLEAIGQESPTLMGISVHLENQVHERSAMDQRVWEALTRLLEVAPPDGLLVGVHPWGDTMFNSVQLNRLISELDAIVRANPPLADDAESLRMAANSAIRQRGYLWFSGD
jgi:hypothetical protein